MSQSDDRPRVLRYSLAIAEAEQRILEALPDVIDRIIEQAKGGDLKAAAYLADRILGRVAGAKFAPVDDRRLGYTEEDLQSDRQQAAFLSRLGVGGMSGATGRG